MLWAAREIRDGTGYDIRSFSTDGRTRYIEVKATKLGALTPFYITSAELEFARRHRGEYAIYRVFDIDGDAPEFYVLGETSTHCWPWSPSLTAPAPHGQALASSVRS